MVDFESITKLHNAMFKNDGENIKLNSNNLGCSEWLGSKKKTKRKKSEIVTVYGSVCVRYLGLKLERGTHR